MLHYILLYLIYIYVNKELELKLKFLLYVICRNIYSILIVYVFSTIIWWLHQTKTFSSALLALCEGNSPVIGGYLQYHRLPVSFNGNKKNSILGTDRQQQTEYDDTTTPVKEHMITMISIWYDDDNDSDDDDDDDDDYNILYIQLIQIVLHYDDNEIGHSANIRIRPSDNNVHYYSHTS